jgi:hypothetical protein
MEPELSRMKQLQQVNANIEVYKRILQTDMPQKGKDTLLGEIQWLEEIIIPQLLEYDV